MFGTMLHYCPKPRMVALADVCPERETIVSDTEAQFSGIERGYFQSLAPASVSFFPAIGKPGVDVVYGPRGKIHQQLHEVELRIHLVPAPPPRQPVQDPSRPSAPP